MLDKYYNNIRELVIDTEIYDKVKDYSKERNRVINYYKIGSILNDAGKEYGKNIIGQYSEKLMKEFEKKYNERTLRRMRQFYVLFKEQKWSTLSTISWSHYTELMTLGNLNEIYYYLNSIVNNNLSVRELREKIKSKEYERLDESTKIKLIENKETEVFDFIKNPIVIKNNLDYEIANEKALKRSILENIDGFLLELGTGFTYVENEYKIKIGNRYNYIDILLFNYIYNWFIAVELKITEFKAEYIGQITKYMNYIDKNIKNTFQEKTIGLIICKKDNKYVLEYCSDPRILTREYILI